MTAREPVAWERLSTRLRAYEYVFGDWRLVVLRRSARSGWWATLQFRHHYLVEDHLLEAQDDNDAFVEAMLMAEAFIRKMLHASYSVLAHVKTGARRKAKKAPVLSASEENQDGEADVRDPHSAR